MAHVKTITVEGITYDIKDEQARQSLNTVQQEVSALSGDMATIKPVVEQIKSDYVTATTEQTISGSKTFSAGASLSEGGSISLAPVNNDSSNKKGIVDVHSGTEDCVRLHLENSEGLTVKADGKATCTSPDVASNDKTIATTGYINAKFKLVDDLPAVPVAGVFYFIAE